ncbi:hypothetical protein RHMOL_Rhmol06G0274400 [Rhododendron molle]|uniref:Uncharacterized protein n=1 Tax=Rhododendron molle TaxID=49168 RepID=A0ACC0NGR1_RHOML|nr:hypothetical protein RHMOL_Rhmol06G0274400 [Rhododendron molle]
MNTSTGIYRQRPKPLLDPPYRGRCASALPCQRVALSMSCQRAILSACGPVATLPARYPVSARPCLRAALPARDPASALSCQRTALSARDPASARPCQRAILSAHGPASARPCQRAILSMSCQRAILSACGPVATLPARYPVSAPPCLRAALPARDPASALSCQRTALSARGPVCARPCLRATLPARYPVSARPCQRAILSAHGPIAALAAKVCLSQAFLLVESHLHLQQASACLLRVIHRQPWASRATRLSLRPCQGVALSARGPVCVLPCQRADSPVCRPARPYRSPVCAAMCDSRGKRDELARSICFYTIALAAHSPSRWSRGPFVSAMVLAAHCSPAIDLLPLYYSCGHTISRDAGLYSHVSHSKFGRAMAPAILAFEGDIFALCLQLRGSSRGVTVPACLLKVVLANSHETKQPTNPPPQQSRLL